MIMMSPYRKNRTSLLHHQLPVFPRILTKTMLIKTKEQQVTIWNEKTLKIQSFPLGGNIKEIFKM